MPREIIIGKTGNQPFALNDPKVSRQHARLVIADDGRLQLIDTGSTNGTFIYNGQQFVRITPQQFYPVAPDTMIQLGPETRFHVRKLLGGQGVAQQPVARPGGNAVTAAGGAGGVQRGQQQPPKPQPKKCDIGYLRKISDDYNEKKMEFQAKQGSINSMRSLTLVASLVATGVGGILGDTLGDKTLGWVCGLGVALLIIIVLMSVINHKNKQLIRQQNDNEKNYKLKYCCPECGISFYGKMYENILAERRCPRCKAEYYESPRSRK